MLAYLSLNNILLLAISILLIACNIPVKEDRVDQVKAPSTILYEEDVENGTLPEFTNYPDALKTTVCQNFTAEELASSIDFPKEHWETSSGTLDEPFSICNYFYNPDKANSKTEKFFIVRVSTVPVSDIIKKNYDADKASIMYIDNANWQWTQNWDLDIPYPVPAIFHSNIARVNVYISKNRLLQISGGPFAELTDEKKGYFTIKLNQSPKLI